MSDTVADKRAAIMGRINNAQLDLRELQAECEHTFVTRKACANTGNYDPSADSYWWEYKCPCCGCFWTEDQRA